MQNRQTESKSGWFHSHQNWPWRTLLHAILAMFAIAAPLPASEPSDFESDIAPLLIRRCVECHQGPNPAGELALTTRAGLRAGGDSGDAIDFSSPLHSPLLSRIETGEMPPPTKGQSQKLPADEIQLLRQWIASGASWPEDRELDYFERTNDARAGRDWWSLQPVLRPDIPRLRRSPQPLNPIDAFVQGRLEAEGILPAPKASRRTLIRRAYHDLLGLPPSQKDIDAFLADESPDAWLRLINGLLERPQYGERWARYWLDLARYADTSGYERDQEKPFAWKYRDWVVNAFNADMPYDQFIIAQLAGDEQPDRSEETVIATGFLRLGTWNDEPNDKLDYQYERLEDLVHTTSSTFLGLTVKCARCHSHKFDPITQEDYYRMASAFWAGLLLDGELGGPTAEQLGFEEVLGWTDKNSSPPPLHLLKNGERQHPLQEVVPASLSSIPWLERTFDTPPIDAKTSGRRLQLAQWISDSENPLTARVLVNRIWQHHFGQGIVRSPDNFGFVGEAPTHPELLDWLAAEFQTRGQSMKAIHRLILTSETWQQSSVHPNANSLQQRDSGNRLLWRSERRRLDAEALRDSLLAVTGELSLEQGGKGFKPTISPEALAGLSRKSAAWQASPDKEQNRRSIYMYLKRGLLPPMMSTFDLCEPTLSCGQRDVTTVPTQALALLNNDFMHARSEHLASTLSRISADATERIRLAWSSILQRSPTQSELDSARRFLAKQQLYFSKPDNAPSDSNSNSDSDSNSTREIESALVLHFRADQSQLSNEDNTRVQAVHDLSGHNHHATQMEHGKQPILIQDGIGGEPSLHFDGEKRYLNLSGRILEDQSFTILCVVKDQGSAGHREILSNWNGTAGNSTTSLFLGLTDSGIIRFSDAFSAAGSSIAGGHPLLLSAVNGPRQAAVFQNGTLLNSSSPLPSRRLDTSWVIGQQGNIDGEYWHGDISEIRLYNRELTQQEREVVERQLAERYGIDLHLSGDHATPDVLALASLCQTLMCSNEFMFID